MNFHETIVEAARRDNGWQVVGLTIADRRIDEVPHGLIAFRRDATLFDGREYGTAKWAIRGAEVQFYSGRYDLNEAAALESFTERLESFTR